MTPCEEIGLKVGDGVMITEKGAYQPDLNIGDYLTLHHDDGSYCPYFITEPGGLLVCLSTDGFGTETGWFKMTKTEAEKRGAKFGTMGVVKSSGNKCVYIGDCHIKEKSWEICVAGSLSIWSVPYDDIRLDHEPEFKEVRFCDATHEQRMVSENLKDEWGQGVSDVFWSEKESIYVILLRVGGIDTTSPNHGRYTVRIPA